ncbi:MAG: TolC family protein [Acidobacteria bacterium]|nr:TolC family protein [Acidobacteriota bacterium]
MPFRTIPAGLLAGLLALAGPLAAAQAPATRLTASAVEEAILAQAPDIWAARAAVDAAMAELRGSGVLPDLGLEAGVNRTSERAGSARSTEPLFGVEWELPLPGRFRSARDAARAGVARAEAALAVARVEVRTRVRILIAELGAAEERRLILEQQHAFAAGLADLIGLRADLGESRELERLRARVELGQVDRELSLARAEAAGIRAALVRLSGGRLPAEFELADPLVAPAGAVEVEALVERALSRSPDVARAAAERDVATAAVSLARAERSPSVVTRAQREVELEETTTTVSAMVRLPLWNANRAAVAAARSRLSQAELELEALRRGVAASAQRLAHSYVATRAAAERSAVEVLPAARTARELAELSYREGEISLIDVLDARRAYQAAALQDLEVRFQLHRLRVELESLTGPDLDIAAMPDETRQP